MPNTIVNGWTIESQSPYLTNLAMTPSSDGVAQARIGFTAELVDDAPVGIKVTPGAATNDLKFIFDPILINHTGFSWFSADFDLVDDVTVPVGLPAHTPYAHFHDASNPSFPNWENPTVGPFVSYTGENVTTGVFQDVNGANQIHLSAGATGEFLNNTSAALKPVYDNPWRLMGLRNVILLPLDLTRVLGLLGRTADASRLRREARIPGRL